MSSPRPEYRSAEDILDTIQHRRLSKRLPPVHRFCPYSRDGGSPHGLDMKSRLSTWLTRFLLGVMAAIPVEGAVKGAVAPVASEPHAADLDAQELTTFMNQFHG